MTDINIEATRAAVRKFYGYGLESRDVDQFLRPMHEAIEEHAAVIARQRESQEPAR